MDKACSVGDAMPFLSNPGNLSMTRLTQSDTTFPVPGVLLVLNFNEWQSLLNKKHNDHTAYSIYSSALVPGDVSMLPLNTNTSLQSNFAINQLNLIFHYYPI